MAITPLEQMLGTAWGGVISDPLIDAILVLALFWGFAIIQGPGIDRKVAIGVAGTILACCFVPWLFVILAMGVGVVLLYPVFKRLF